MNKTKAIRAYAQNHPEAKCGEIIEGLAAEGITVASSHVAYALGNHRSKTPKITQSSVWTKWYKPDVRAGSWIVIRVDRPDSKGTVIGPVKMRGTSNSPKAHGEAIRRNRAIFRKREALMSQGFGPPDEKDDVQPRNDLPPTTKTLDEFILAIMDEQPLWTVNQLANRLLRVYPTTQDRNGFVLYLQLRLQILAQAKQVKQQGQYHWSRWGLEL